MSAVMFFRHGTTGPVVTIDKRHRPADSKRLSKRAAAVCAEAWCPNVRAPAAARRLDERPSVHVGQPRIGAFQRGRP
jgi:hypothetical protein